MATGSHTICEEALQQLNGYMDAEISAAAAREICSHLQDCPPCEDHFEVQAFIKTIIRTRIEFTVETEQTLSEMIRQICNGDLSSPSMNSHDESSHDH